LSDLRISAFISGYVAFRTVLAIARFVFSSIGSWVNRLPFFPWWLEIALCPRRLRASHLACPRQLYPSINNASFLTQKDHTHKLPRGLPQIVGAADSRHTKW
jgi:hypothetical protein